jgi:phage tail-like protein
MNGAGRFFHANLANVWTGLVADGVVTRADGALTLASLPAHAGALGEPLTAGAAWVGAAGLAVDRDGHVWVADPRGDRIVRLDACDGGTSVLGVPRGTGSARGRLRGPRGLAVGPGDVLYVADSGNHRIYVVSLATLGVPAVWGQPDPDAPPAPAAAPGRLDDPWDVAAGDDGALYVVDHGNARVQKFAATGAVVASFWDAMAGDPPQEPAWIAVGRLGDGDRVVVLDRARGALAVHRTDGTRDDAASARWQALPLDAPAGVALAADAVYVGDAGRGRVGVFDHDGTFIGFARGFEGPVAGVMSAAGGRVIVHPGAGGQVARLAAGAAHVTRGSVRLGPFRAGATAVRWDSVRALADPLPAGAHVQLLTCTTASAAPPPAPPAEPAELAALAASAPARAGLDVWRAAPRDALDILALNVPGRHLWVAAVLESDGRESAVVQQLRVEYEHDTWLRHLPAVYTRTTAHRELLEQALAGFQAALDEQERRIDELPRLFDPMAAPSGEPAPAWLDWLSGWLALDLDHGRPEAERRAALAGAAAAYARRGTVDGLRALIAALTGADAHVDEAAASAAPWTLGAGGGLGFGTTLVTGAAQGAVLATTATLDGAHLIDAHDRGAPVFDDLTHRVCVQVRAADVPDARALAVLRRLVDAEVPAHVVAHVCVAEPRLRVGVQARLGIDAIVGGPGPALVIDEPRRWGLDAVLGDAARPRPGAAGDAPAFLCEDMTATGEAHHGG